MIWKFIKIPKAVALLAFALPWMTVSCSNQKVAEANGWQLVVGQLHKVGMLADDKASNAIHLNYLLAGAMAVIVIGLVLTFLPRAMPRTLMASAVAAFALIWAGTSQYTPQALAAEAKKNSTGNLDEIAISAIQVDWQWGFWVALGALGVVLVMAWMAMNEARTGPPGG